MKIETRFNLGDYIIVIEDDKILRVKVTGISYQNGHVYYRVLVKAAHTSLDRDKTTDKTEENCFASIEELAEHYKNI